MRLKCVECKCALRQNNRSGYCTEHGRKIAQKRFYSKHPKYNVECYKKWWAKLSPEAKKEKISNKPSTWLNGIKDCIERDLNRFDILKLQLEALVRSDFKSSYRQKIKNLKLMLNSIQNRILMNRTLYENIKIKSKKGDEE